MNDATALVAYRIGVAAVVTGAFSPGRAALQFLVTGAGGAVVGLGIGWLIGQVRRRTPKFPIVENTISLLTPFLAYIPADWMGLSGVLAVVAVGLYLGRQGPRFISAATRVQAESTWTMIQFLLESFIFMLVGLELPYVLRALRLAHAGRADRVRRGRRAHRDRRPPDLHASPRCRCCGSGAAVGESRAGPHGDRRRSSAGPPCAAVTRWSSPWRCRSRPLPARRSPRAS